MAAYLEGMCIYNDMRKYHGSYIHFFAFFVVLTYYILCVCCYNMKGIPLWSLNAVQSRYICSCYSQISPNI